MSKDLIWFTPAVLVAMGIFALSTFLALPIQVEGVSNLDKWQHTFAYFVLSFSFLFAYRKTGRLTNRIQGLVLLVSGAYGLLLEFVQYRFFAYRYFEWADALANLLGAVLGFLIFLVIRSRIRA